jgi:hypothetical protein
LATNKNSVKKSPNIQNFNIVIICLKAKDELSNWLSKHHSTLAALTPIKLFVEMLKFPENIFFKEKNFKEKIIVKESEESERIFKNIH